MPSFTLELWRVIDFKPEAMSLDKWLGMDEYPIFDADYREGLNKKIREHFMYQEIGHETIEQFRFSMRRKLNEIMPLYNQLYESTRLEFDPFVTVDIKSLNGETASQTASGKSSNETKGDVDSTAKNIASAFPQVMLGGNKDYATSGADSSSETKSTGETTEESSSENTANRTGESSTKGYQGNPALLLQQYRASMINTDMLVINDLDELFMAVWNNGDEYARTNGRFFFS